MIFESISGDWLAVTATDASNKTIAKFNVPSEEVLLPGKKVHLHVTASQRLSYTRKIDPVPSSNSFNRVKAIQLEDPASHRWILDDIVWYQSLDFVRNGELASYCIALRTDSIVLLETISGDIVWSVPCGQTHWGNSVRGCPSSFQPDRCVVVKDTNGNECQEIVFAHPSKPELLCLDSSSGELLWRTDLLKSAGIQTPDAGSLCPIIMHYDDSTADNEASVDEASGLCVIVAPHVPELAIKSRWLMSVDPATGQVGWNVASQQTLTNTAVAVPIASRPLHVQWGEVEKRPLDIGLQTRFYYYDDYWKVFPNAGISNPYDSNVRLGTHRPFTLGGENQAELHWIDGQDWHVIKRVTGELRKAWQLPDDCVCSPKLLRTSEGRTLVLVDRSAAIAGHWSETATASSLVAKNWFQRSHYDLPYPRVVTESTGKELLAVPTCFDGIVMVRLLDWGDDATSKLRVDRTVRLPIDPGSAFADVRILDCDGDGTSDYLSISDAGIDCLTLTGEVLWQRPPPPVGSNVLYAAQEIRGRSFLGIQTDPGYLASIIYLDVRTGEVDTEIQSDPKFNALNAGNEKHASLITQVYTTKAAKLSAIRRSGTNVRRATNNVQHATNKRADPRYVRLLPWVVLAKDFSYNNPVAVQRFSWLRILTLSLGVFLLPLAVGWSCIRVRFSLRQLWLVATTIAIALSLALADRSAYPTDAFGNSYLSALQTSATIAVVIFLFALPIMELARKRWRRRLSLGVYCGLILVIPAFTLLLYPTGVIQTTYTFQEFWHLFWFALLPTGAVLFLVHSLRILGSATAHIVKGCWRKLGSMRSSNIRNYQGAGDSHGG